MSLLEDIKRLKAIKKQFTAKQQKKAQQNTISSIQKKQKVQDKNQSSSKTQNIQLELESSLNSLDQKNKQTTNEKQRNNQKRYRPQFLSDQEEIDRLMSMKKQQIHIQPKVQGLLTSTLKSVNPKKSMPPTNLFANFRFCFPFYNAELTKQRAQSIIKNSITPYGGEMIQLEDLLQMAQQIDIIDNIQNKEQPQNSQQSQKQINENNQTKKLIEQKDQYPYVNYFLIDKNVPRQNVEKEIGYKIGYDEILDVNYIFDCLKVGKILETDFYIIKRKDQQFYNEHIEKMKKNLRGQDKCQSNQFTSFFTNPNSASKGLNPDPLTKKGSFNQFIAESFERLKQMYEKSDRGRAFAYGRASSIVKSLNKEITCQQDVDKLVGHRFLGKKTLAKIKQMITTGSLERLNMMSGKQVNMATNKLGKVWGIGKQSAIQLYNRGIKSVQQLQEAFDKNEVTLTKNQKIGLKYYKDLQIRMPRDKVTRMFEFVKKQFFSLVGSEQFHNIQVAGSYRRKKETCGDMDILITRKDGRWEKNIVNELVQRLKQLNFITDILTMPRHLDPKSCVSFMGICQFEDETHHRIDIKYYPLQQYAYALLYFTGSGEFNRLMRLHALRKGFKLSDHGMSQAERISMTKTVVFGSQIICMSEQQIFAYLSFEYKLPEERSL